MTEKDRDEVKEILVNILPVYCGVEDMELSNEQDSLFQLHELNRLLREINIPELIEYFQKNKQIVKICNKIQGITEELNTILTNDLDAAAWLDRGRDYYRRKYEVERKVDAYYINNLQNTPLIFQFEIKFTESHRIHASKQKYNRLLFNHLHDIFIRIGPFTG